MNGRRMIRVWLFLSISIFHSGVSASSPADTLRILLISDTHICNLSEVHPFFAEKRSHYGNGFDRLKDFLQTEAVQNDADAVVIQGDLVDFFEASRSNGDFSATQVEQFASLVKDCPVPLFMILGNHDIASYWVEETTGTQSSGRTEEKSFEVQSFQKHAQKARAAWIRNLPCFQYGTYYEKCYQVGDVRYHFLFLDNGYSYKDDVIDQEQYDWLEYRVKEAGSEPVLIFMHKYLPFPDLNGDGMRFTSRAGMAIDSAACSRGFLKILNENRNIKALLVGHGHTNVTETAVFPRGHRIVQTETAGFASDPNSWRMMKFTENEIFILPCGNDRKKTVIPVERSLQ